MKTEKESLRRLVEGMRAAFERGENAMAWARAAAELAPGAVVDAALIAYDLQAGSYTVLARKDPDYRAKWCAQIASQLKPWITPGDRLLEVGVGEATTLSGVVGSLGDPSLRPMGFDLSWSRVRVGFDWLKENGTSATLFVADLFNIPLVDNAVDVVYTSHSLEPNGGRESAAIAECLRVARKAVILVEPIYELASEAAQQRMASHGYVRNLREAALSVGAEVQEYRLLDVCANRLNPSGVLVLKKRAPARTGRDAPSIWQCPVTASQLFDRADAFFAPEVGLAYPVMRSVPLLRADHAVVASRFETAP